MIEQGELSSTDLVASCLERIDAVDPALNAFITTADEAALAQAAELDDAAAAGKTLGPLHGLPVAIKDIQRTKGLRTTYGSKDFANHVPDADDGIVARIRSAGGVVIGKTNVPEFSIGANTVNPLVGATGNPFDPTLTCGGSSGGSGVAVATGMAPLATGSDHGGSLRIPACYSGVVGYRATPGVVPNEQRSVTQTFYSLQGPMARSVGDVALLLSVIAGRTQAERTRLDPMAFPLDAAKLANPEPVDPAALRVAISEDLGGVLVSETIRRTFNNRMEQLSSLVQLCERHPIDLTAAPATDWRLRSDLFIAQYADRAASWNEDFNPNIRSSYQAATETTMEEFGAARRTQMELYQNFQAIFNQFDVLICPGASVPPFPWTQRNPEEIDGVPVPNYMAWLALTSSLTVVGHPVIALPCGLDENGTPFGVQVVGPMYGDRRLLGAAAALEQAFNQSPELGRPRPNMPALSTMSTMSAPSALSNPA